MTQERNVAMLLDWVRKHSKQLVIINTKISALEAEVEQLKNPDPLGIELDP